MGLRQSGRGVSLPASPLFFVTGHHVPRAKQGFSAPDVVLHRPQTLCSSSPGTTSSELDGPSAPRTWCFIARKPLVLRRRAPRPPSQTGFWRPGRGASPLANPYSFVAGHHVLRARWAFGAPDVVLHRSQTLIPSSPGTTSSELNRASAVRTWCLTARKPLFLRRWAPRPPSQTGFQQPGRDASLPASPYSFVDGHHVPQARWAFGDPDVVLHRPLALIPSSTGTTSPKLDGPSAAKRAGSARTYTDVGNGEAVSFCSPQKIPDAASSAVVGDSLSPYSLTAFICFSSTRWNYPHSHPRFDLHR